MILTASPSRLSAAIDRVNNMTNTSYVTKPAEIISLGVLVTIGNLTPYALPVIVGALVDHLHLEARLAGYLGTAELIGLGLGAAIFSGLILKVNWRMFALCAISLSALANLITPFAVSIPALFGIRFISGLGGGMLLAMSAAGLSSTRFPERVLGSVQIFGLFFSGAILYVFPLLLKASGAVAMFFTVAGLNVAASLLCILIPRKSPYIAGLENTARNPATPTLSPVVIKNAPFLISLSTLSGIFLFFTGAMGFWVFFERVGVAASFSTESLAKVLGGSQIMGAAGALAAVLVATRLGSRLLPMGFSILLAATCALLMTMHATIVAYAIAGGGFIFAWGVIYPYMMGIAISLDPSARIVGYALALQTVGKSIGPALAASLVIGSNFTGVYWLCLGLFLASLICFLPAIFHTDLTLKADR